MTPFNQALVDPIKIIPLRLGNSRIAATGVLEATSLIRIEVPTCRIHWHISVGWFPYVAGSGLDTSSWQLNELGSFPGLGEYPNRNALIPSGTLLPASYEAESAAKVYLANCSFVYDGNDQNADAVATVRFEPSRDILMSAEERSYWESRCKANVLSPEFLLGPSV